jgi:hypothetical protein
MRTADSFVPSVDTWLSPTNGTSSVFAGAVQNYGRSVIAVRINPVEPSLGQALGRGEAPVRTPFCGEEEANIPALAPYTPLINSETPDSLARRLCPVTTITDEREERRHNRLAFELDAPGRIRDLRSADSGSDAPSFTRNLRSYGGILLSALACHWPRDTPRF